MTDRPILMSGPMVRAILREIKKPGTGKTQTRRVLKPQPPEIVTGAGRFGDNKTMPYWKDKWSWFSGDPSDIDLIEFLGDFRTGYCEGNRLWIRETWGAWPYAGGGIQRQTVRYRTEGPPDDPHGAWRWRPSIHMPRRLSRITLEVTAVRIERLQEISDEDALAEGIHRIHHGDGHYYYHAFNHEPDPKNWYWQVDAFHELWDSINAKREGCRWADNPWVAAIAFKPHLCNIDKLEETT